jgi:hypothetical protein
MGKSGMHPPAYYLALRAWARWVGTTRGLLVLPIYALGLVSLFLLGGLARRLVPGAHGAEWAMLLLALSPWFVEYTNLARPYAWVVALTIVSTTLAVALDGSASAGRRALLRVGFVLVSVVGVLSLYHYAFVIAWQLALLGAQAWLSPSRRQRVREVMLLAVAITCGFGVWAPNFWAHLLATGASASYFSGFPSLLQWPALTARLLSLLALGGAVESVVAAWVVPVFAVLGPLTVLLAARSFRQLPPQGVARSFWWSTPLLPLFIGLADWAHGTHTLFVTKTSFALLPILLLAVVRAFSGLPETWRRVGLAAWVGLFAVAIAGDLHTRGSGKTPMEIVAAAVARSDDPSHVLVVSSTFPGYLVPLLLELRTAGVREVRVAYAPWFRLDALIDSVSRDRSIARLTLVNLDVSYSPPETWQPEHLARVRTRAGHSGWQVTTHAPSPAWLDEIDEEAARGDRSRRLQIVSPVEVKYFSF